MQFNLRKASFSMCLFIYSGFSFAACIQNPRLNNITVNVPTRTYTLQYDDASSKELGRFIVTFANGDINTYSGKMDNVGKLAFMPAMLMVGSLMLIRLRQPMFPVLVSKSSLLQ